MGGRDAKAFQHRGIWLIKLSACSPPSPGSSPPHPKTCIPARVCVCFGELALIKHPVWDRPTFQMCSSNCGASKAQLEPAASPWQHGPFCPMRKRPRVKWGRNNFLNVQEPNWSCNPLSRAPANKAHSQQRATLTRPLSVACSAGASWLVSNATAQTPVFLPAGKVFLS